MNQNGLMMSLIPVITSLTYVLNDPQVTTTRVLLFLIPSLLPVLLTIPSFDWLIRMCTGWFKRREFEFTSRLRLRVWDNEVKSLVRNFSTVLIHWNSENKMNNCMNFVEESVTSRYYNEEGADRRQQAVLVDDNIHYFHHVDRPHIEYKMWVDRNTDQDGVQQSELLLTIRICKGTPKQLMDHILFIYAEAKRIRDTIQRVQQVFVSSIPTESDSHKSGLHFMVYNFNTTSSFRNFFCEEADIVKSDLDYFLGHKDVYERTGRPWTYTILNEGPPGVGKTKLVKAIAEYTGYTLFVINLSHITNIQMLYETFHVPSIGGEYVPHDKRIYYIPEVDTQALTALKEREKVKEVNLLEILQDSVNKQETPQDEKDKTKEATKSLAQPKQISLGEILNVMDGVPERYGHIMIFDTNCLKTLDPAFLRPGRIDRLLSWKLMSTKSVTAFLTNFYSCSLPVGASVPDRLVSAAELNSIVSKHPTIASCLDALNEKKEQ